MSNPCQKTRKAKANNAQNNGQNQQVNDQTDTAENKQENGVQQPEKQESGPELFYQDTQNQDSVVQPPDSAVQPQDENYQGVAVADQANQNQYTDGNGEPDQDEVVDDIAVAPTMETFSGVLDDKPDDVGADPVDTVPADTDQGTQYQDSTGVQPQNENYLDTSDQDNQNQDSDVKQEPDQDQVVDGSGVAPTAETFAGAVDSQNLSDQQPDPADIDAKNRAICRPASLSSAIIFPRIYDSLVSGRDDIFNVVLSTYSMINVCAMVILGAQGESVQELRDALCFPSDEDLFDALRLIRRSLEMSRQGNVVLNMFNNMFLDAKIDINNVFRDQMNDVFAIIPVQVDYKDPNAASASINKTVSDGVCGKIPVYFPDDCITDETNLIMGSGMYFKSDWMQKFDPSCNTVETFYMPGINGKEDSTVQVCMMNLAGNFCVKYINSINTDILCLPMSDCRTEMLFFIPREINGLNMLEQQCLSNLNPDLFNLLSFTEDGNDSQIVCVNCISLPKFRISSCWELTCPLQESMGVKNIFDGDRSDFSCIAKKSPLFVQAILQKSFIEITEDGAETTGITTAVLASFNDNQMIDNTQDQSCLKADHPFLFFVRDCCTSMILFGGKVVNPCLEYQVPNDENGLPPPSGNLNDLGTQ